MNVLHARGGPSETSIELTVTRADGRIERLGIVAYWHRNPVKRAMFRIKHILKKAVR